MTSAAQPFGKFAHTKSLRKKSMFRNVDLDSLSSSFPLLWYLDIAGYLLSMIIVLFIYSVHVRSIVQYPYFAPSANVEELAYTHISDPTSTSSASWRPIFCKIFPPVQIVPIIPTSMITCRQARRCSALIMRVTGGSFVRTVIVFGSLVPIGFGFTLYF